MAKRKRTRDTAQQPRTRATSHTSLDDAPAYHKLDELQRIIDESGEESFKIYTLWNDASKGKLSAYLAMEYLKPRAQELVMRAIAAFGPVRTAFLMLENCHWHLNLDALIDKLGCPALTSVLFVRELAKLARDARETSWDDAYRAMAAARANRQSISVAFERGVILYKAWTPKDIKDARAALRLITIPPTPESEKDGANEDTQSQPSIILEEPTERKSQDHDQNHHPSSISRTPSIHEACHINTGRKRRRLKRDSVDLTNQRRRASSVELPRKAVADGPAHVDNTQNHDRASSWSPPPHSEYSDAPMSLASPYTSRKRLDSRLLSDDESDSGLPTAGHDDSDAELVSAIGSESDHLNDTLEDWSPPVASPHVSMAESVGFNTVDTQESHMSWAKRYEPGDGKLSLVENDVLAQSYKQQAQSAMHVARVQVPFVMSAPKATHEFLSTKKIIFNNDMDQPSDLHQTMSQQLKSAVAPRINTGSQVTVPDVFDDRDMSAAAQVDGTRSVPNSEVNIKTNIPRRAVEMHSSYDHDDDVHQQISDAHKGTRIVADTGPNSKNFQHPMSSAEQDVNRPHSQCKASTANTIDLTIEADSESDGNETYDKDDNEDLLAEAIERMNGTRDGGWLSHGTFHLLLRSFLPDTCKYFEIPDYDPNNGLDWDSWASARCKGPPKSSSTFFTICHYTSKQHWVLLECCPTTKVVNLYDSMHVQSIHPMEDTARFFAMRLGFDWQAGWRTAVVSTPQQSDQSSCGVFALACLLFRVMNWQVPHTLLQAHWRFAFACLLGDTNATLPGENTAPRLYEDTVPLLRKHQAWLASAKDVSSILRALRNSIESRQKEQYPSDLEQMLPRLEEAVDMARRMCEMRGRQCECRALDVADTQSGTATWNVSTAHVVYLTELEKVKADHQRVMAGIAKLEAVIHNIDRALEGFDVATRATREQADAIKKQAEEVLAIMY